MHSSRMHTACSSSHLLGGCLPQCMLGYTHTHPHHTPPCGPGDPPGCGPRDSPGQTPQPPPPGCGLETPPSQTPQPPPWVWAWKPVRHARIPPHPPPLQWTEFLTHASENITLPHLHCQKCMSKDTTKMLNQLQLKAHISTFKTG